jgi:leucyl/phenylalanyl-tRNA--protein transferase
MTTPDAPRDDSWRTLTPEIVLRAYAAGIFPMADGRAATEIYWVDPEIRGILPLDKFHVPRRLKRKLRSDPFEVHANTAFAEVIHGCAAARNSESETWINDEIIRLFTELHRMGFAHSVECWRNGALVGGLYGVALGATFFGESMFSRESDASKIALVHLVARLRHGEFMLLDTQFVTEHLETFGAIGIRRTDYRRRLAKAIDRPAQFYGDLSPEVSDALVAGFLQSTTQTS